MYIQSIPLTWSAGVLLARNEGWQCRKGTVLVTTEASGADDRGILLREGGGWTFPDAATVYYRAVEMPAAIYREVIA